MKEYLFRAWIPRDEIMFYHVIITPDQWVYVELEDKDIGLGDNNVDCYAMMKTDLHDKKDISIYEGDIVKALKKDGSYRIAPVVFHHGHFMLTKTKTNKRWISLGNIRNKDTIEVIGNIYEDADILNK